MIEFALVVPVVLLLLVAIVEVAVVGRVQLEVTAAAREGARYAATSPDPADASAAVRSLLGSRSRDATIAVSRPHVVGRPATVRIRLPVRVAAPLFGGLTVELTASSSMRVER